MHLVGGKEAAVARTELAALPADFRQRTALEQVADLLDARVRMRQRALALFDGAVHHLQMARADRFRADQAAVQRADMVGRVITGDVVERHEIGGVVGHGQCLEFIMMNWSLYP